MNPAIDLNKEYGLYKSIDLLKDERAKLRSKTFPGIAQAMAEQWG